MDAALAKRCTEFNTAISRLSLLSAHDALILFRASFSAPKMMLRCSPCTEHPLLEEIDNILRKGVCAIANLALTDVQWLQASLPVKEGGLGVRRVTSLAPSAFLASATGTETLQQQLLLRSTQAGSMTQLLPPSGMYGCLLYTSPSPRDRTRSRMPSSA